MNFWHPPQTLITFGSLNVHTYGIILTIAILSAYFWSQKRASNTKIKQNIIDDILFWSTIGGIIGARLGFVIQNLTTYSRNVISSVKIWEGGLSFHGAIIGGAIAAFLTIRHYKLLNKFWEIADVVSAPILLGAIIGRLGNWANQELYGYPTQKPWAINIDPAFRLPGYEQYSTFHPTFAYEMIINSIGLAVLILLEKKLASKMRPGFSFAFVIAWYGLARGITEIWRIGDRVIGPLSLAQILSILMILISYLIYRGGARS